MQLEQRRQAMLQLQLSDQQVYHLLRCDLYEKFDSNLISGCSFYELWAAMCPAALLTGTEKLPDGWYKYGWSWIL